MSLKGKTSFLQHLKGHGATLTEFPLGEMVVNQGFSYLEQDRTSPEV